MARSISVKIPTASLIESIEARIAEIDKAVAEYPAKRDQYEQDKKNYQNEVVKFASDFVAKNIHLIGNEYDSVIKIETNYRGRLELSFDSEAIEGFPKRPEEPTKPNQTEWFGREHTTRKQLLEKNLKILRMTSQEEVSASTYGAVMELL